MKTIPFLATLGLMVAVTAGASSGGAIDELNMGLSQTSVFDTPTPTAYSYSDAKPGWNDPLPRAWEEAPPQVPHQVDEFLPVIAADNQCLDCHDVPKYIDQPKNMDRTVKSKSPMSPAHYTNSDLDELDGARFNCTQCHVPQSNAAPLVESTYR
jgi:cytochrome c-type protein NapB